VTTPVGFHGRSWQRPRSRGTVARVLGFTLLELVIVIAIIAIIAAIAWPAYLEFLRRANRADAKAVLIESAQFMERYYTTNGTYAVPGPTPPFTVSPKGSTGTGIRYDISFSVAPTALIYTLQAVPNNSQTGDRCGTMTVSNTGAQTAAQTNCW